jgi:hypothetical protein
VSEEEAHRDRITKDKIWIKNLSVQDELEPSLLLDNGLDFVGDVN